MTTLPPRTAQYQPHIANVEELLQLVPGDRVQIVHGEEPQWVTYKELDHNGGFSLNQRTTISLIVRSSDYQKDSQEPLHEWILPVQTITFTDGKSHINPTHIDRARFYPGMYHHQLQTLVDLLE